MFDTSSECGKLAFFNRGGGGGGTRESGGSFILNESSEGWFDCC